MSELPVPAGMCWQPLRREHPRRKFSCGKSRVDQWLSSKALQHQAKHLSATKVLMSDTGAIAAYYTLAIGQVDFSDLPEEIAKPLPRRVLPVAVLAWLGVDEQYQRRGMGSLLLAQALRDCWEASHTFPFVAVILDCIDDAAKSFYLHWNFAELPGHPYKLFLSASQLDAMMDAE